MLAANGNKIIGHYNKSIKETKVDIYAKSANI